LREVERVGERRGQRVEHHRPVAVDHPLGPAGGARGEAHPEGLLLAFDLLDVLHERRHLLPKGQKHVVHDQKPVAGVLDDVGEVGGVEP